MCQKYIKPMAIVININRQSEVSTNVVNSEQVQ